MTDTPRFGLTLIEAAQAQKHVSVNEALARIDALSAARVEVLGGLAPPTDPPEGTLHGVGPGATGDWAGHDGRLALALGGGWVFADPWEGLSVFDASTGTRALFTGGTWVHGALAGSPGGALTKGLVIETDHTILTGATSTTAALIPDKAVVIGVTARVVDAIGGATAWSLGVPGSPERYGSGYGVASGAFAHSVTGQPQAYYGATPLLLTAEGGAFTGGTLRLAVHLLALTPPD